MMKLTKMGMLISAALFSQAAFPTAYDDDQASFYVEGQTLNQALSAVNQIMCFVANMRSDAFVNAGPYKATIYEEDCVTGADSSGDSSAATATSASSSSTASSTSGTTSSSKTATTSVLNVTRLSSVSPVVAKTWVSAPAQQQGEMANKIYVDTKQTGGPSETSPNGDFVMRYSVHADGSQDLFGEFGEFGVRDGQFLGQGYLSASGQTLKFKEYGQGQEGNVIANFKANGDKSGVYGEYAGFFVPSGGSSSATTSTTGGGGDSMQEEGDDEGSDDAYGEQGDDYGDDYGYSMDGEQVDIFAYYQFYMSAADKSYCRRLLLADQVGFPDQSSIEAAFSLNEQVWAIVDEAFEDGTLVEKEMDDGTELIWVDADGNGEYNQGETVYEDEEQYAKLVDVDGDGVADYSEDPWLPTETAIYDVTTGLDNLSQYAGLPGFELVVGEECFSTDLAKAQRNVHRYGVYNQDGSRLEMTAGGFPLIAFVDKTFPDGTTQSVPVHAFADYWGVHVDPRGRGLIDETTAFTKESFDATSAGAEQNYNLKEQDIKIEKRTTSYISLNSIDGLTLAMHVNDWWWLTEYKALFGDDWNDNYDEYEGTFDKSTSTFTWTKGISFRQGYNAEDLETPISFTVSDWQSTMIKEWGKSTTQNSQTGESVVVYEDWYRKEIRNMGVWSHDTRQWYEISNASMSFPAYADELVYETNAGVVADAVAGVTYEGRGAYRAGIRTESSNMISISDVAADMTAAGADKLYCIRDCIDGALVQQTFTDALSNTFNEPYVSTPYANIGEYLKEDITYSEVTSGFSSLGETTSNFTPVGSITTNTSKQIKLGKEVFAVTDYVGGVLNQQLHSRGDAYLEQKYQYGSDATDVSDLSSSLKTTLGAKENDAGIWYIPTLQLFSWAGLSATNLNKLLEDSSDPDDFGIAPSLHFDLKEIPAAGTSGTMKMIVTLYEGNDDNRDGTEMSLSSEATLNWSSDGSKFTITIPETASTTMTLITSGGAAITGTYGNSNVDSYAYGGGVISTGTAGDGEGITWKIFRIFAGHHHGLQDLYALGNLDSFFQAGQRYTATVMITDTDLSITKEERDWDTWDWENDTGTLTTTEAFKYAVLNFDAYEDSSRLRQESRMAGEYAEGLQIEDMWYYTVSNNSILDQNGNALSKGTENANTLRAIPNPEALLMGKMYQTREGWGQDIAWGIRTGELVLDSDLSKMECRKNGSSGSETYDNHPIYGTSTANTRYCSNKLWEGAVDTKYNISMETRPSYEVVFADTGEVVDIDEPKVLYYEVPETVNANNEPVFGKDAGKRIRLEYAGFGELYGIPGFVFDTATGEELGEFVNNWSPTYRYLNRFNIPDGGIIEDATDATVTYKVKALNGEEWLSKYRCSDADCTSVTLNGLDIPAGSNPYGAYTSLYEGTKDDLVPDRKLRVVGPEDWNGDGVPDNVEDYIGDEPTLTSTPAIIEGGKTCVVQGEVLCGANAGS